MLFPEVTGSTTIYLVSDKASTLDIVGVSSTAVENFGPFSTGVQAEKPPATDHYFTDHRHKIKGRRVREL